MGKHALFLLAFFAQPLCAQTISGQKSATVNEPVLIKITGVKQAKLLLLPENPNWAVLSSPDGFVVLFIPKQPNTYNLVVGVGDTLVTHSITVTQNPNPNPTPIQKEKYVERFSTLIDNREAARQLSQVIERFANTQFSDYSSAAEELAKATKNIPGLQKLRSEISKISREVLGTSPTPFNQQLFQQHWLDIAKGINGNL